MTEEKAKEIIKEINFSCKQVDQKDCPWVKEYRPHWKLIFSYEGKRVSFDFWNNLENKPPDKLETLEMILSDACYGLMDIDEFFKELGIEKVSEGLRSYKACQKTAKKIKKWLNCSDDDLYTLANTVREFES